jgi:hypothetical protein
MRLNALEKLIELRFFYHSWGLERKKERKKERKSVSFLNTAFKNTHKFTESAVSIYTDN